MSDDTTHFGYERVQAADKADRVRDVFDSVASRYDLMNDLMSLGVHRVWKRFAVERSGVRPGDRVLDLAGGTGDMGRALARRAAPGGRVVIADINASMIEVARSRLIDQGVVEGVDYVQADAEQLPFPDDAFDCLCIAFGLRNVTDKDRALGAMYRVLRPGGRAMVLEFSSVRLGALRPLYDAYSFSVLPRLGAMVAGDARSYQYLAESIRMHPDQETLAAMMGEAGFERIRVHNLSGGIAALHLGHKL